MQQIENVSIQERFARFHKENPHVYEEIIKIGRQMKARGFKHYSIRTILHIIRWHKHMQTNDPHFKISNNHSSRYVRLLVKEHPEFDGFFQMNKLRAE